MSSEGPPTSDPDPNSDPRTASGRASPPPVGAPATSRHARALAALAAEPLDVLIVGGGITGAGAAREAARRGLKTGLIDQGDLAAGTSSKSSKLVHGGLRYLEQLALGLVFEAVSERRVLLELAPHLVRPLAFLFPVFESSRRGLFTLDAGLWIYDALSLFRSPKVHKTLRARAAARAEPALRSEGLRGASIYWDCATDDARLTLETALDAERHGALLLTHARVEKTAREGGRVVGAKVASLLEPGATAVVRARAVVNATGPWSDLLRRGQPPALRPTKGVHVVVDAARLPLAHAVVLLHPRDGRVMFAIPWGDRAYIGTTDTDFSGDPADVAATRADVDYCLEGARWHFPDVSLGEDDVISTWAGLRPLVASNADHPSNASREHMVVVDPDGLVTIAGGKLTTYRRMAIDVIDAAVESAGLGERAAKPSATDKEPLPGGAEWPSGGLDHLTAEVEDIARGALTGLSARLLAESYGTRAREVARLVAADPALGNTFCEGRPEVWAQVVWASDEERAETLSDVLARRTGILLKARDQGLGCCEAVAGFMAPRLGWSEVRRAREVNRYLAEVRQSRRWREEPIELPPSQRLAAQTATGPAAAAEPATLPPAAARPPEPRSA